VRLAGDRDGRRCLEADGGGRGCWEVDGDASSKESLRGRFFVRDNDVRSNSRVGDVSGAVLDSVVPNAEDDASDIIEQGCVFLA
jgi:hypothetical protein